MANSIGWGQGAVNNLIGWGQGAISNLIGLCEQMNNDVADTYTVQKSTYFHDMTKKIDSIVRHHFNPNM